MSKQQLKHRVKMSDLVVRMVEHGMDLRPLPQAIHVVWRNDVPQARFFVTVIAMVSGSSVSTLQITNSLG